MPLVPRTFWVDVELETLSTYLAHMSSYVATRQAELQNTLEEMTKDLDPEDRHDAYEFYSDEIDQLEREFPRLLFSGYVTSCYSFIETQLLRLCHEHKLSLVVTAEDREPQETGIYRARKFLKDAAGYQIPARLWQELLQINFIRNRLVHERGRLPTFGARPEDDDRNYEAITVVEDYPYYVRIDRNNFTYLQQFDLIRYEGPTFVVQPTPAFCQHITGFAKALFHAIYDDLAAMPKKVTSAA